LRHHGLHTQNATGNTLLTVFMKPRTKSDRG
jgi:hypothetical protein